MKKFYLILTLALLLASCLSAGAQERIKRVPSITLGYAPMTTYTMDLARRAGNIRYKFDPAEIHASFGYERQRKGVIALLEVSYAKTNVKSFEDERSDQPDGYGVVPRDCDAFKADQFTSLQEVTLLAGAGITLFRQHRIQLPIYFCAGPGYVMGHDIHNVTANLGGKARMKIYLTNSIGIWGGYAGHASLALKTEQDEGYKKETFSMINFAFGPEFGLIFSF